MLRFWIDNFSLVDSFHRTSPKAYFSLLQFGIFPKWLYLPHSSLQLNWNFNQCERSLIFMTYKKITKINVKTDVHYCIIVILVHNSLGKVTKNPPCFFTSQRPSPAIFWMPPVAGPGYHRWCARVEWWFSSVGPRGSSTASASAKRGEIWQAAKTLEGHKRSTFNGKITIFLRENHLILNRRYIFKGLESSIVMLV